MAHQSDGAGVEVEEEGVEGLWRGARSGEQGGCRGDEGCEASIGAQRRLRAVAEGAGGSEGRAGGVGDQGDAPGEGIPEEQVGSRVRRWTGLAGDEVGGDARKKREAAVVAEPGLAGGEVADGGG